MTRAIAEAEGSACSAELRAPVVWKAELSQLRRELTKLKRQAEKIAAEIGREG